MPTNRLHNWVFNVWSGPTPPTPRQHITTHTRAGVAGTTHTKAGLWGDPFDVDLTAYYQTFLLANDARAVYVEPLAAAGLVRLWWCGLDYLVRYQTIFKVVAVGDVQIQTLVRVVGEGNNFPAGARLTARLTLHPHAAK